MIPREPGFREGQERGAMKESDSSPQFHRGEREIQERLDVRERLEDMGRRFIRDHLPEQHREFYAELPLLLVGSVDEAGRPWASVLFGRPGFVTSPDPSTLSVASCPVYGDPLNENLAAGADVGILGIEFHTRRRNRLNGQVARSAEGTVEIRVAQAFGNCPQYIQARDFELLPEVDRVGEEKPVRRFGRFRDAERELLARADNFYIASYFSEDRGDMSHGTDVSHRGGKPGFVRIDDERTLTFPDFLGNFHFNTLGNILLNPRIGLLFIDFDRRDLLYLTGSAEILWDSEEGRAFTGAERLVRFTLDEGIRVDRAVPIKWEFRDYSPSLTQGGSWEEVAATVAARREGNQYRDYRVTRVQPESTNVTSFYLEPEDAGAVPCHQAGQFLPLELHPPGVDKPIRRTYTISNAPNGEYLRLSIKREGPAGPDLPPGLASNSFHDHVRVGTILRAMAPRGKFTLDECSVRPVVLLSAGVGITPMISMLEQLVASSETCGCERSVWFIHGARNGAEHAFSAHVRDLGEQCERVRAHFRYSRPAEGEKQGRHFDSVGHVDISLMKSLLPFDDYDFYLCGPTLFMQAMHEGLKSLNVSDARIHYEFFGEGASLHRDPQRGFAKQPADLAEAGPVMVRFARSEIEKLWEPSEGTLLDLAESEGLTPPYSCRSGICQTCSTKIVSGDVVYLEPPMAPPENGEALICCCYPRRNGKDEDGEAVVLDL
jgi:ferredoxin-NADP reductase/predicted pyridoxine 5'-phosphate oxidase superfamily flavin-nucleotide-binding protein